MAQTILFTLVIISSLVSPILCRYSHAQIKAWCSHTPHPQPCEYFLTHNTKYGAPIKGKSDFFKLSTKLALDRCAQAHRHIYTLGPKCNSAREKAAWADCMELYEYAIQKINKTVDPTCTSADAQTWLSAALTNLETCKDGFADLHITDNVKPLMSNNVSALLSNTLALNKGASGNVNTKDGFPTWLKPGERKLLQSSTTRKHTIMLEGLR